jgi:hypothetical protein
MQAKEFVGNARLTKAATRLESTPPEYATRLAPCGVPPCRTRSRAWASKASCSVLGSDDVVGEGWAEEKTLQLVVKRGRMAPQLVVLGVMALQERCMVVAGLCRVS